MDLLDKANINHRNLELSHCFYPPDGDVEFGCFIFGDYSTKKSSNNANYDLPEFEMPQNLTILYAIFVY